MLYSEKCIDPTAGFDIQPDGSMKPRKLGYPVMTLEEAAECEKQRMLGKGEEYYQNLLKEWREKNANESKDKSD